MEVVTKQMKNVLVSAIGAACFAGIVALGQLVTGGAVVRMLGGVATDDLQDFIRVVPIVVRSPEQPATDSNGAPIWREMATYEAGRFPGPPRQYVLDLGCASGTELVAAWPVVKHQHTVGYDLFHPIGIEADTGTGEVRIGLLAREKPREAAYLYVDVFALCMPPE